MPWNARNGEVSIGSTKMAYARLWTRQLHLRYYSGFIRWVGNGERKSADAGKAVQCFL